MAVILVGLARMEQHVRDTSDGNETVDAIAKGRKGRTWRGAPLSAKTLHAAIAEAQPAARQTDLPKRSRQRDGDPERLFSMIAALQRPVDDNKGPVRRHAPRQSADRLGRQLAETARPLRTLRG